MSYKLLTPDSFFQINASLVEGELNFSRTVTMSKLVDLSDFVEYKKNFPKDSVSYTALIIMAAVKTLKQYPMLNCRVYKPFVFLPYKIQHFNNIDLSLGTEVKDKKYDHVAYIGVFKDVGEISINEINERLIKFKNDKDEIQFKNYKNVVRYLPKFLAKIAMKTPNFIPSLWTKFRGGALLVSSPGKYGVDQIMACWNSTIGISFGQIKERALVKDSQIKICPSVYITANFDRRIVTGAMGAKYLNDLCEFLEKPQGLMIHNKEIYSKAE